MNVPRIPFATLAVFLAGCQSHELSRAGVDPHEVMQMPYGLTCDRCLYQQAESCARAGELPVAAVVEAARVVDVERSCIGALIDPSFPIVCNATRLYEFGRVKFLKNDANASVTDRFEAGVAYPQSTTTDFETTPGVGPLIGADGRYVIFAGADRRDLGFASDWYISIACRIDESEIQGTIP